MPRHRFTVTGLRSQNNERGVPMVLVEARAAEGDAFHPPKAEQPDGYVPVDPVGKIVFLANEDFVRAEDIRRGTSIDLRFSND